jgi:Ran GTPase-activating protein (RanGAP) involved in mRNA processing and transport
MSVSNDSTGTIDDGRALLSSTFLDFCAKVRNSDPSILPELGHPLIFRHMSEKEGIELADALLENTNVTYLELERATYTTSSAEAMANYVRTSKRLQRIHWNGELWQREDMFCCFLTAIQESSSLKELHMVLPPRGGPSSLALENMLTRTQSLRSLALISRAGRLEDKFVAAASSGLKRNTTLRELTLIFTREDATIVFPILTSLRDHPLLRNICLRGNGLNLTGLETLLLSNTSKITELEIDGLNGGRPMMGWTPVLQALARRPTLTKLGLRDCAFGRDEARLLRVALCKIPSLQSLDLANNNLGNAELAELAPALYHNTSIKVLDISGNRLNAMESAEILRDIIRSNKTMTALDLSRSYFGRTTGTVVDGLGSNSTLLKIDLTSCHMGDGCVSTLARNLGSRNTTLQKLTLDNNLITSTGVGVLLETMEQSSHHITYLDLDRNRIGNEGASLLARSLGNNALPNLTRLSLSYCNIGDDGFIALVSALTQNASLLQLELRKNYPSFSERAFLALAGILPEIKVLQRIDFRWCAGLSSAMPLLLAGLRKNKSLFRFHFTDRAPSFVPPTIEETARCAGGWMQEMECLGYRNRFLPLIRRSEETHRRHAVWPHALARVATLPDVIFEVLRSKPKLVSSGDTEATEDTGALKKRKCIDLDSKSLSG